MRKSAFIIGFATVLALVLVMLCSPAQAGSSFIQDSIDDGSLVLYHDYRAGHTQDLSGQGNHGTSDAFWSTNGLQFSTNEEVTVTDGGAATELQLTEGTLIVIGEWSAQTGDTAFFVKRDAGGTNYQFRIFDSTNLGFYDGVAERLIATSVIGKKYVAANFKSGENWEVFIDGISGGTAAASSTVTGDDADLIIGNWYLGTKPLDGPLQAVLIFNDKLSATEHAQLNAELTSLTWPKKGAGTGQGTYGAELVSNGDMETGSPPTGWLAGNSATLTAQTNRVLGGDQVLRVAHNGVGNPFAYQAALLTVGTEYRATGWARGDGTGIPTIATGTAFEVRWTGTTSTTWQRFDLTWSSLGVDVYLRCAIAVAGNCEFDNVTVTEVSADHTQFKSDWNAKVSANITSNYIHDTPLEVTSGAYKVEVQTVKGQDAKVMECTNAGIAGVHTKFIQGSTTQDAYGTWEFTFSKAAGSTLYASFVMDEAVANGYMVILSATEQIILYEIPAGTTHFATAASYFSDSTFYTIKVTRRQSDGMMTVYLDGVEVDESGGAGANPVADTTHTTSEGYAFDMDAGDIIVLGTKDGNYAMVKKHGVQ
jgi:hypothetical protein